jgi:hypothetical protein
MPIVIVLYCLKFEDYDNTDQYYYFLIGVVDCWKLRTATSARAGNMGNMLSLVSILAHVDTIVAPDLQALVT